MKNDNTHQIERNKRIMEMIATGKTFSQVADEIGVTKSTVAGVASRNQLPRKPRFEITVSAATGEVKHVIAAPDMPTAQHKALSAHPGATILKAKDIGHLPPGSIRAPRQISLAKGA